MKKILNLIAIMFLSASALNAMDRSAVGTATKGMGPGHTPATSGKTLLGSDWKNIMPRRDVQPALKIVDRALKLDNTDAILKVLAALKDIKIGNEGLQNIYQNIGAKSDVILTGLKAMNLRDPKLKKILPVAAKLYYFFNILVDDAKQSGASKATQDSLVKLRNNGFKVIYNVAEKLSNKGDEVSKVKAKQLTYPLFGSDNADYLGTLGNFIELHKDLELSPSGKKTFDNIVITGMKAMDLESPEMELEPAGQE